MLDAVAAGDPGFLAVVGEPGIGKTSLMERLSALAGERGWLVLAGRAAEFERELPFGVLVDALDDHLAGLDQRKLERAGGERLAELAAIFPSLDGPGVPEGALKAERYRAHRAVQELLDGLAVGRPLLLALDDLHWADQASLEVVASLLRRPPDGPVLLACAFRPSPAPDFLESAIAVAEREGRAERIDLGPLTPEDAAELLATIPDRTVRDAVFRVSGGNPFYLSQLARLAVLAPVQTGDGRQVDTLTLGVPQSVLSMLAEEIRMLPPGSRRVLEAAAVAGRAVRARRRGRDRRGVRVRGDRRARRPAGARPRARHRRPAPVPLPPSARAPRGLRACRRRLAARRARPCGGGARGPRRGRRAQAHHVEHSARRGDEAAIGLLRRAAETAAARAPATAARWLQAAVRLVPEEGEPGSQRRVELLMELADAQRASGRLEACRMTLLQALDGVDPGRHRPARGARHRLRGGRALARPARRGAGAAGRGAGRAGRATAPPAPCCCGSSARSSTSTRSTSPRRGPLAEEAHALGRELGDPLALAASGAVLTLTAAAGGDVARGARAARGRGAAAWTGCATPQLADDLAALWYLGWAEIYLERFDAGVAHLRRALAISRAAGRGDLIVPLLLGQARGVLALGAHAARRPALTDEAVEVARGSGNPQYLVWALWERGWTALVTGDHAQAQALARGGAARRARPQPDAAVSGRAGLDARARR